MKFINYTAFKITAAFIAGILCCYYLNFPLKTVKILLAASLLIMLVAWLRSKKQFLPGSSFGFCSLITLFLLGAFVYLVHQPINQPAHYTGLTSKDKPYFLQLKIRDILKPDKFNHKYIAEIIAADANAVSGKIMVTVPRDSIAPVLSSDMVVLVNTNLQDIPISKNPYQFDYAEYLRSQGIYHQIRVNESDILSKQPGKQTLNGIASFIRNKINVQLKDNGFQGNELSIINALLLGQRQELSREVYDNFKAAGAVHILAVSGLHVGIIMLFLQFLLKPLEYLRKGKFIKVMAIVLLLWLFAILAGLSPSVLRAATMFSFLAYALNTNRETSTYNTLITSAFLLLLINPNLIFHVGFQLSYLAVFAIVWIQPMLYKLYRPKLYLDKLLWGIATVTVAAQLGVAPLSVYYFNQFPGLFFITNLIILPFLGLLLGCGIIIILLVLLNLSHPYFTIAYTYLLSLLIHFIDWVAAQDSYIFENISFSIWEVLTFYLLIAALILLFRKVNYKRLVLLLIIIAFIQTGYIIQSYYKESHELVLFHKNRESIMGFKNGQKLTLFTTLDSVTAEKENRIKNYKRGKDIQNAEVKKLRNIYEFDGATLLVIDSTGVYPTEFPNIHYVYLRESPKIHLEKLIDTLKPKQIIADGSNYRSYINRWKITCENSNIPFHYTGEKGAFILSEPDFN